MSRTADQKLREAMTPVPVDREVVSPKRGKPDVSHRNRFDAEIAAVHIGWHGVLGLVDSLGAEKVVESASVLPLPTQAEWQE